jgi:bacillithiol biosynthesis deacetylase BshB1
MKLDLLAIAAHPDDAELACSGTLVVHKRMGLQVGVVDLTAGELGSRGDASTRKAEAKRATEILQLDVRENLGFRDGFFVNDEIHQRALITSIRKYRPDIVLANAPKDRHPDHAKAALLIKDACFLSGLHKIETQFEGQQQEPWRPKKIFNYIQDTYLEPDLTIDISSAFETKINSIKAYGTQFFSGNDDEPVTYISQSDFLETIECRSRLMGKRIGVKYGEGFLSIHNDIGLNDFTSIILPEFV